MMRPTPSAAAPAVVVIGVSTGGPQALERVLPRLPAGLAAPVLVVQHMPPMFTRLLAERFDRLGPLRVREAEEGAVPLPGEIWIAAGGRHLAVVQGPQGPALHLNDGPPENSCRPAADVLFRSAAEVWGARVLAVVLTGMGKDGLAGCRAIREAGGAVLAQDRESSVVWGMPGAVADAGLAESLHPLDQMALAIALRVEHGRARGGP